MVPMLLLLLWMQVVWMQVLEKDVFYTCYPLLDGPMCTNAHHILLNPLLPLNVLCLLCWSPRDLPVSYIAAKENAFNDPSHDMVLHHGAGSFANRTKATPLGARITSMDEAGYTIRWVTRVTELGAK